MDEKQLIEAFSAMSEVGAEAFNSWLTFKYVELVSVPFTLVFIVGFIGWGLFQGIKWMVINFK